MNKKLKPTKRHHIDRRADATLDVLFSRNIPADQLLNTKQVAVLLNVSQQWVEIARQKGEGPPFTALSKRCIRYRMGDFIAWLQARRRSSTKEGVG